MKTEDIRIDVSPLTSEVYAGEIKNDKWVSKVNITDMFLQCCVKFFEVNTVTILSTDAGKKLKMTLEEVDDETE